MKVQLYKTICLALFLTGMLLPLRADNVKLPDELTNKDTVYVYISPERLDVYPGRFIQSSEHTSRRYIITTTDGVEHRYRTSLVDSITTEAPDSLPRFSQFKFNNKFNDQVYKDVIADIEGDSLITASIPAIGKWLTPSFQLWDKMASVYVDGQLQHSKNSRRHFSIKPRIHVPLSTPMRHLCRLPLRFGTDHQTILFRI